MRKIITLGALAALAGCAYPSPQHVQALNSMVGKPEVDLVRTYGVPNRTIDTAGHRFLAYSESHIDDFGGYPGWGGYGGFGYGGWGRFGGFYGGFPDDEIVQEQCTTTFELANGLVQSWKLKGNDC
jgi:hypothetical protein